MVLEMQVENLMMSPRHEGFGDMYSIRVSLLTELEVGIMDLVLNRGRKYAGVEILTGDFLRRMPLVSSVEIMSFYCFFNFFSTFMHRSNHRKHNQ